MKITTVFVAAMTVAVIGACQGAKEPRVIAKDKLEVLTGGNFVHSDTIIPILTASYVEFSANGSDFHRFYQAGDKYFRHSNDSKTTWDVFSLENLTDVLWKKSGNSIYNTNSATATISQNIDVLGHFFLKGDSLKVTDLSASDGSENMFLTKINGKAVWVNLPNGSGIYTVTNVGTGGQSLIYGTSGTDFQFKSVVSSDGSINVTNDAANKRIDLKTNYSGQSVTAGVALVGGGTFDANGSVTVDFNIPELQATTYQSQDQFAVYRPSDDTHYKTTLDIQGLVDATVSNTAVKPADSYILVQHCDSTNYVPATVSTTVTYGALYNFYAVSDARNIANIGWHICTLIDAENLQTYLGGNTVAGGKMKEVGTVYWKSPNTGATNEVGFNARGSSERNYDNGAFSAIGSQFRLWTATQYNAIYGWSEVIITDGTYFSNNLGYKNSGRAIRLIKDVTTLTNGQTGTYIGNDGKIYRTICIGTQEWLADNLAETKYRNGDWIHGYDNGTYTPISNSAWAALTTEAMCFYGNDVSNAYTQTTTPEVPPVCTVDTVYTTQTLNIQGEVGIDVRLENGIIFLSSYIPVQNSAPSNPRTGRVYYDAVLNKLRLYNGSTWKNFVPE